MLMAGMAVVAKKAAVMEMAITGAVVKALIQSKPNCRKTPATMPMTMGKGMASMIRRTHPDRPRISIAAPAA